MNAKPWGIFCSFLPKCYYCKMREYQKTLKKSHLNVLNVKIDKRGIGFIHVKMPFGLV